MQFWGFHRVIGPIRPYGNTHLHLGRSFGKTGYVVNGHFCCINRYTSDTRCPVASRPSRAIQLYSAIYTNAIHFIIQLYIAIHTIQPLHNTHTHPSALEARGRRPGKCGNCVQGPGVGSGIVRLVTVHVCRVCARE